jgi:hypothetical protein
LPPFDPLSKESISCLVPLCHRWRGDRLYEAPLLSGGLGAYDVRDAGHPVEKAALAWRRSGNKLFGSGRLLYQHWKTGLIEFQPETSGVEALRYLDDGDEHDVQDATLDGEYVYAWKEVNQSNRVEAFWTAGSARHP